MATIGLGLVGCGNMGASLARGLGEVEAGELVAVYDERAQAARELADATGARACSSYEELLGGSGVEAVLVASPQFAHREHTVAAAGAGKHVFCEKPMATSLADCDAMLDACRQAGRLLMIGQVCRYHAVHAKVHELVAGGGLGPPVCMEVHRLGKPWGGQWDQHWRLDRAKSGGNLLEVNAHEIDFMRWVCGDVAAVYAAGGRYLDQRLNYPDLAVVTLHFASGAKGLVHAGSVSLLGGYGGRVDCRAGSLAFPTIWGGDAGIHVARAGEEPGFLPASELAGANPVAAELGDFLDAVASGRPAPVPGEEGRAAVEAGLAAYRSIETGAPVELPL
ncbi:MAG: Gfo/Idh/MocA family protein [Candidatus Brocadiia bacterium]